MLHLSSVEKIYIGIAYYREMGTPLNIDGYFAHWLQTIPMIPVVTRVLGLCKTNGLLSAPATSFPFWGNIIAENNTTNNNNQSKIN